MSAYSIQPDSLEIHPDAHLIPLMLDEEYQEFKADIKDNGQKIPVTVYNNMILDGRHRAKACKELGIELLAEPLSDTEAVDTVAMVLSLNLQRRHLSGGQRAALGNDVANLQRGGNRNPEGLGGKSGKVIDKGGKPPLTKDDENPIYTRNKAAVQAGTTERDIGVFRHIEKHDPDLALKVRSGETSLYSARAKVQKSTATERSEKKAAKAVEKAKQDTREKPTTSLAWVEDLPQKHKDILFQWMLDTKTEAKAEAHQIRKEADKKYESVQQVREMLRQERKMLAKPFDKVEFKMIRAMLHPDKHPENLDRANKAFELFNRRLEKSCG